MKSVAIALCVAFSVMTRLTASEYFCGTEYVNRPVPEAYANMGIFSSPIQWIIIVSCALLVTVVGVHVFRLSLKRSSHSQRMMGALVCFTLLPLLLAWARREAGESQVNAWHKVTSVENWDSHQLGAMRAEFAREGRALIWISVSGLVWLGASALLWKGERGI